MRRLPVTLLLCCLLVPALASFGQTASRPAEEVTTTQEVVQEHTYQTGEWWEWKRMTGDWFGVRPKLEDAGVTVQLSVTQILQENVVGGYRTNDAFKYDGKADLTLLLDTYKMGLWKGGEILLHAEPRWGKGVNPLVGSLSPVNLNAFKPTPEGDCVIALSEWIYFQHLFDNKLILVAGKLFGGRAFDRNVFANDERTQFMNAAFVNNLLIPTFAPYTNLGVGAIINPCECLSIATAVLDGRDSATRTGFDTAFHAPSHTTVVHEWAVKVKPFDQPGNQRVGFFWTDTDFEKLWPPTPFRQTAPLVIGLLGPKLANRVVHAITEFRESTDNTAVYYNFDQYLYHKESDPTQGFGLFGRFGWARGDINALNHFYSIGLGGKGMIECRDNDTYGVGYYHMDLSNQLPYVFSREAGVEAYYNIEVTPWLHITPDIQVIVAPGGMASRDCSFVWGLRFQMDL